MLLSNILHMTNSHEELPELDDAELGARIHELIWRSRMTQTDLGRAIGVSQASASKKLRGEVKITAIEFASLPLKDAIVWKKGDGKRRIAVFADPNCGYCKRFEKSLQEVDNITVYTFVIPILGGDSPAKSRAAWCAKDNTLAWRNWMIDGTALPKSEASCDATAIDRNLALSQKIRVTGTPAILFEDGTRAPGAISPEQLEQRLQAVQNADKAQKKS